MVEQSYRRALAYPLYRSFPLCEHVHALTSRILSAGRSTVIKCLLAVHHILSHNSERRHLLNTVFVNDYLVWTQAEPEQTFTSLAAHMNMVRVERAHTQWPLEALEREAQMMEQGDD